MCLYCLLLKSIGILYMLTASATSCFCVCVSLHMKMTSVFLLVVKKKDLRYSVCFRTGGLCPDEVWEIWQHAVCEISVYL